MSRLAERHHMSSAMAGERLVAGLSDVAINRRSGISRVGASVQHLLQNPEDAMVMRVAQPVRYQQPVASVPVTKGAHGNKTSSRSSGNKIDGGARAGARGVRSAVAQEDASYRPYAVNGERRGGVRRVTSAPASGHQALSGRVSGGSRMVREEVLRRPDAGLQVNGFGNSSSSSSRRPASADNQTAAHPVYRLTGNSGANSVAANLQQRAADSAAAAAAARSVRSAGGLLGARAQHRMGAPGHQFQGGQPKEDDRGASLSAWTAPQQKQEPVHASRASDYHGSNAIGAFRVRSAPGARGGTPFTAAQQQQPQQRLVEGQVHGGNAFTTAQAQKAHPSQQQQQQQQQALTEGHVHGGTHFGGGGVATQQQQQLQQRRHSAEDTRQLLQHHHHRGSPRSGSSKTFLGGATTYGARNQEQQRLLILAEKMISGQQWTSDDHASLHQQQRPHSQPGPSPSSASALSFSPARGVGARGVTALIHNAANPLEPSRTPASPTTTTSAAAATAPVSPRPAKVSSPLAAAAAAVAAAEAPVVPPRPGSPLEGWTHGPSSPTNASASITVVSPRPASPASAAAKASSSSPSAATKASSSPSSTAAKASSSSAEFAASTSSANPSGALTAWGLAKAEEDSLQQEPESPRVPSPPSPGRGGGTRASPAASSSSPAARGRTHRPTTPAGVTAAATAAAAEAAAIAREDNAALFSKSNNNTNSSGNSSGTKSSSRYRGPHKYHPREAVATAGSKKSSKAPNEGAATVHQQRPQHNRLAAARGTHAPTKPDASGAAVRSRTSLPSSSAAAARVFVVARTTRALLSECQGFADDLGLSLDETLMSFLEEEDELQSIMAINGREPLN